MFRYLYLAAVMGASPALADVDYFDTPSGNISCSVGLGRDSSDVSCTIYDRTPTLPRAGGCSRSGHTVWMNDRGPVTIECDQPGLSYARPAGPGPQVLEYGQSWDFGGIRCTSSTKGLECRNAGGHGFFLSRARQSVW
ncbi:hypothetical protein AL036_06105 [Salipiger aestuarii]|uniref:CVNH domain-containing protein n=1 Tax=Salipiger aestuarii TaxID=568098 RepID=A0A327YD99_9RHOB|nr:DUF6636 domain-containing protein [Salipiger aestuarii]EIE52761.1 hypothetical protein C357_02009 [Citreicella sp. 357]KAA8608675.1 hypothetical protein AL036_06105 [Salipiger aestuarii]KAA8613091.1 hypothetical protein AL037_06165 [Salipiger aestuarii]KAB2542562.1 hypothetical protein AL035_06640 [Salipiger aestuarii]RAK19040.1 hypothetical protein ATI53_101082 [Salipiger aestuarii]